MRHRHMALLLVLVLTAMACSNGEGSADSEPTTSTPAGTAPTVATTQDDADDSTTSTGDTEPTTLPTIAPEDELPGDPLDFGPDAGVRLGVVGVAFDDTLNLREAPGTDQTVLAEMAPVEEDITALGQTRQLPNSIWYAVEFEGIQGWVSSAFVAQFGDTVDLTSQVVSDLGELPSADAIEELALVVAVLLSSQEPPSRIQFTSEPAFGDLADVFIDVVGLGDDSQAGWRLHVFGIQNQDGTFTLNSVEATILCIRGVSDGLCL